MAYFLTPFTEVNQVCIPRMNPVQSLCIMYFLRRRGSCLLILCFWFLCPCQECVVDPWFPFSNCLWQDSVWRLSSWQKELRSVPPYPILSKSLCQIENMPRLYVRIQCGRLEFCDKCFDFQHTFVWLWNDVACLFSPEPLCAGCFSKHWSPFS